jgi:hypothetical protein
MKTVRAPICAAPAATAKPADPAPMTQMSALIVLAEMDLMLRIWRPRYRLSYLGEGHRVIKNDLAIAQSDAKTPPQIIEIDLDWRRAHLLIKIT